jgi:putative spermidine/putrescine transport system substrate-binding protein
MTDFHDDGASLDFAAIAADKLAGGAIDRRTLLRALSALGVTGLALPGSGHAAPGELVVVNFGGPEIPAFKAAFGIPLEKATGLKVVIDGSGPRQALIRAAVQAHAVAWDVCDTATLATLMLGEGGFIEPIDYTIVDARVLAAARCRKLHLQLYPRVR